MTGLAPATSIMPPLSAWPCVTQRRRKEEGLFKANAVNEEEEGALLTQHATGREEEEEEEV